MTLHLDAADGITPHLRAIANRMENPRPLMAALGGRLEHELREHFLRKDAEPNARGWPKSHFWNRVVRKATALSSVSATRAVVTIASPELVHRVQGGPVRPKRAKALAIPANAAAYKAGSPREADADQLEYVPIRGRGRLVGLLRRRRQTLLKRVKGKLRSGGEVGGEVWYWLLTSVTHRPDPDALPRPAALQAKLLAEAGRFLRPPPKPRARMTRR